MYRLLAHVIQLSNKKEKGADWKDDLEKLVLAGLRIMCSDTNDDSRKECFFKQVSETVKYGLMKPNASPSALGIGGSTTLYSLHVALKTFAPELCPDYGALFTTTNALELDQQLTDPALAKKFCEKYVVSVVLGFFSEFITAQSMSSSRTAEHNDMSLAAQEMFVAMRDATVAPNTNIAIVIEQIVESFVHLTDLPRVSLELRKRAQMLQNNPEFQVAISKCNEYLRELKVRWPTLESLQQQPQPPSSSQRAVSASISIVGHAARFATEEPVMSDSPGRIQPQIARMLVFSDGGRFGSLTNPGVAKPPFPFLKAIGNQQSSGAESSRLANAVDVPGPLSPQNPAISSTFERLENESSGSISLRTTSDIPRTNSTLGDSDRPPGAADERDEGQSKSNLK